jgi:hypothetical protein
MFSIESVQNDVNEAAKQMRHEVYSIMKLVFTCLILQVNTCFVLMFKVDDAEDIVLGIWENMSRKIERRVGGIPSPIGLYFHVFHFT